MRNGSEPAGDDIYTNAPVQAAVPEQDARRPPKRASFRKSDGHQYHLSSSGLVVYGGSSEERAKQQRLVALGADRYFDLGTRTALSVVRNASGTMVGLRARQAGKSTIWYRLDH